MQVRPTVVLLFLLCMQSSHAQDKTSLYFFLGGGPTTEFGKGLSNKNFSPSDPVIYKSLAKIGFSFGVAVNKKFTKHFGLTARLLSEGKGANSYQDYYAVSYSGGFFYPTYTYQNSIKVEQSISFITLSIIPQYSFKKFNIGVGGYIGTPYEAMTKATYINYIPYLPPSHSNPIKMYQNLDAGLIANIGYTIPLKDNFISFQLSDSYGLKNILVTNQVPPLYLNSCSLLVGFSFGKINRKYLQKPTL